MTPYNTYKLISSILGVIIFIYIFNTFFQLGYTNNMPIDSEARLFLSSFIGSAFVLGGYIWIAYEIYDRYVEWRIFWR